VRLTNERVGVFLARRSVQHLVFLVSTFKSGATSLANFNVMKVMQQFSIWPDYLFYLQKLPE
jgi:hypothetical protein